MNEKIKPELLAEDLDTPDLDTPEKKKTKPIDALVVFGGGILSDQDLESQERGKSTLGKPEQGWRLPLGAKLRVLAASELYLNGQVEDVILTGGPMKKNEGIEDSEAQLMRDYFLRKLEQRWRSELLNDYKEAEGNVRNAEGEIRPDIAGRINEIIEMRLQDASQHVLLEDKATNTIENFAHTINFIDRNPSKYQNIALLSNNFHIDRIVKLAGKMGVKGQGIGSEDVVADLGPRYETVAKRYFDPEENSAYRQEVLAQLSSEDKTVAQFRLGDKAEDRPKSERRWSRGLDEIPEYWLPNIKFIENPERLKNILSAEEKAQAILKKHGIENIETASPEEIHAALASVERILPPKEWEEE